MRHMISSMRISLVVTVTLRFLFPERDHTKKDQYSRTNDHHGYPQHLERVGVVSGVHGNVTGSAVTFNGFTQAALLRFLLPQAPDVFTVRTCTSISQPSTIRALVAPSRLYL